MTRYNRVKSRRKVSQAISNMETARGHLTDFLAMGWSGYESINNAVMGVMVVIDEAQKALKRVDNEI